MPMYREIVAAAGDTATAILRQRTRQMHQVIVTTNGGSTASVNWGHNVAVTLNLPTLPADTMLTRAEADRIVGYIAHECCHVMHTDWNAWMRAVHASAEVKHLTNCLEDVRIERAEIEAGHYPALRGLLGSLVTQKHAEALAKAKAQSVTIGTERAHFPYVCAVLGRLGNGYSIPTAHALERDLSPAVRRLVTYALRKLPGCQNTEAVRRLAIRLCEMAHKERQEAQQKPQEPQQGQGERQKAQEGQGEPQEAQEGEGEPHEAQKAQEGEGEPQDAQEGEGGPQDAQEGEGEGEGEPQEAQEGQEGQGTPQEAQEGQEGQGTPQEAQEGQSEAIGDQPGAGSDQSTGGAPEPEPEPEGEPIDPDTMQDMVRALAERNGIEDPDGPREHYSHLLPLCRVVQVRVQRFPADMNTHAVQTLNSAMPRCGLLHGQVARMLVADEQSRRTNHETSGRLDRRALVRMRTGAPDVYAHRENTPAVLTALVLLVDQSSSMDMGERMPMTRLATWALVKAAEDAGAKVAVVGFTSPSGAGYDECDLRTMKDWDTPARDAAARIATMGTFMGTPLAPAIITGAEMTREVAHCTRRIVMALTDGQCNFRAEAVTSACRIAASMGVEAVGIGMNCEKVIKAFPDGYSVNIEDMNQLAATGLGTLVRMLEDADRGR
jgi:hypothetical protein